MLPAAFDMDLYRPGTFVSQIDKEQCESAAVQNMLNVIGPTVDTSSDHQLEISDVLARLTTRTDSLNGGHGPAAWALAMPRLGAGSYQLVISADRMEALRIAARAVRVTGRPAGILAWWGAHAWVMTGFRADADPKFFPNFRLLGAYIMDPWYPRVSTIWGRSAPPDAFHDIPNLVHNLPAWTRPEGHYPGRDGKWLVVIPVGAPAG